MVKKKVEIPEKQLNQYDYIISLVPEMVRRGVSMPYTSMNGNMYTILRKDGALGLRLSKEQGIMFMATHDAVIFENYGAKMKEYVEVPDQVLMDTEVMVTYLSMSHAYAKTLKPKPTKR